MAGKPYKDLTGRRFGRLTALSRVAGSGPHYRWVCRCDCGAVKEIQQRGLLIGDTRSCGCLHTEQRREHASWMRARKTEMRTKPTKADCARADRAAAHETDPAKSANLYDRAAELREAIGDTMGAVMRRQSARDLRRLLAPTGQASGVSMAGTPIGPSEYDY